MMGYLLVTGGAGFIGSNFVRRMLREHPERKMMILDALTYAGNLDNFSEEERSHPNFDFRHGDIRDPKAVADAMKGADQVIHFAAETHVDRSIDNADPFVSTDVKGTQVLLEALRRSDVERFIHISTSEVYGTAESVPMTEDHPLKPMSPYAGCKVGADRLAYSYYATYDLPIVIIRPFNNYGPNQFPEKLIPFFILNALQDKPLPMYGDGKNTRDWVFVEDCCEGLGRALAQDLAKLKGEVINLGTGKETNVLTITDQILTHLGKPLELKKFVADRPGHVKRHCASTAKAQKLLGWRAKTEFKVGLGKMIDWYVENERWWRNIIETKREYHEFTVRWYEETLPGGGRPRG
ncbi:hypothetical protein AMJ39_07985 [candidate division TA06 bacterium DG_24]|uniref:dTDP-glucose 4,6-dehydratase n=1 Tax=candidate division TA06 bacterium DG_24 TaxID=1703770 RepID=A0A0S7WR28_UNCT6|nr:MAG: hypothetical protein AMJ39_07985 [candidate division TA06 bacterium DG_24]